MVLEKSGETLPFCHSLPRFLQLDLGQAEQTPDPGAGISSDPWRRLLSLVDVFEMRVREDPPS